MKTNNLYAIYLSCSGVTTDTRSITENTLFFALKGERFDANSFAKEALEKGASYAVIDNADYYLDERTILVENTLETLQQLANYHRKQLNITIIGLTGSNGKTTTKELFKAVVAKKYQTQATHGNLNNHIGVPLTLLQFNSDTEIGIVEMGANHQKEIEFLCSIAEPDLGYITNFGKAHLEGFGGIEGIIKGKSELYDYIFENKKKVLVNLDDPIQKEKTEDLNRFTFSTETNADVVLSNVEANPMVSITFNHQIINSQLIGLYNATNISAAIALGNYLNISTDKIKDAIENYTPTNNRSQIIKQNSNQIILDAYNANPSSMQAALTNFFQLESNNKTAILGDMFELGESSLIEHRQIVDFCKTEPEIEFYFIGKNFFAIQDTQYSNIHFYESTEAFMPFYKTLSFNNSLLLIKGSRGMQLEKIIA